MEVVKKKKSSQTLETIELLHVQTNSCDVVSLLYVTALPQPNVLRPNRKGFISSGQGPPETEFKHLNLQNESLL